MPNVWPSRASQGRGHIDESADQAVARYLDAHHDGAALVEADEVESVLADSRPMVAIGSDDF